MSLRLANALASYLAYIGKMLWPVRLAALYPIGTPTPIWLGSLGALLLIGVTIFAIRAGRRHGYLPVGWLWYVGTLIPVIGLVQVGDQSLADRYTYVPLIGLFLIVAWGAPDLAVRWRYGKSALPFVAACALLACAALARAQVLYWSDSTALWQHAIEVTEGNYTAHNNLGGVLVKQGRADEAIPHFAEALRIRPTFALAQNNMGMALMWQGKLDEAARYFGEALRNQADYVDAQNNLGMALMWQGKLDEAVRHFHEALRLKPDYAEAHGKLGNALAGQGRVDEAIAEYTEALRLKPGLAEVHNDLGVALGRQGKLDEAAQHFVEALRIRPDYADASANLKLALASLGKDAR